MCFVRVRSSGSPLPALPLGVRKSSAFPCGDLFHRGYGSPGGGAAQQFRMANGKAELFCTPTGKALFILLELGASGPQPVRPK